MPNRPGMKICYRCAALEAVVRDLHWMARRYVDGRSSYAPGLFNDHVRTLQRLGIELNPTGDGTIWARDAMGRAFDGLTDEQAASSRIEGGEENP